MYYKIILFALFWFSTTMAHAQGPDNYLIADFNFNGNTRDESRFGNHGSIRGNIVFGTDRFGSSCGAVEFNGKNTYIEVPNSASLQSPTNEFSVAVWFKLHKNAPDLGWHTILCKGDSKYESDSSPQYRIQGTSRTLSISTSFTENLNLDLQKDKWYHYVVTWDGRYVRAFLDGVQFFSYRYVDRFRPNNRPLHIGRDTPGKEEFFMGSMDELKIYRKCLTLQEIENIYSNNAENFSPKPCDMATNQINEIATMEEIKPKPPEVEIVTPDLPVLNSKYPSLSIIAKTQNITSKNEIKVTINGKQINKFSSDAGFNTLKCKVNLLEGQNTFEIMVSNQYGKDKDYRVITYEKKKEKKTIPPPKVKIITPLNNSSYDTEKCVVKARVYNVNKKGEIEVFVNGRLKPDFNYNSSNRMVEFSFSSNTKQNEVIILVNNNRGMDSDQIQVNQAINKKASAYKLLANSSIQIKNHIALPPNDVVIECYDHNKIDNDTVTVILNKEILFDRIGLRAKYEKKAVFKLKYQSGKKYQIISKAWNEGLIPTNTLCIEIHDGQGYKKIVKLNSEANISEALELSFP